MASSKWVAQRATGTFNWPCRRSIARQDTGPRRPERIPRCTSYPTADRFVSSINAYLIYGLPKLGDAIGGFLSRDYCYIGMDHFALPTDSMAEARREGRLHRNFQGHSTQKDCDLMALDVSAIGHVGAGDYQNANTLPGYYESLAQRRLPVVRAHASSADDLVRRDGHPTMSPGCGGIQCCRQGLVEPAAAFARASSARAIVRRCTSSGPS